MTAIPKTYKTAIKGTANELRATIWFLEQGYHVYNAAMPCGPADLIATKNGEILFVDVKTLGVNFKGYYIVNMKQAEELENKGVKTLYYIEETDTFKWLEEITPFLPGKRKPR